MGFNSRIKITESPIKIRIVKSYQVVENVNMRFGGYTTKYTVSKLSMVRKYDLGPNNTRVVTPIYIDVYVTPQYLKKLKTDSINAILNPINVKKAAISVKSKNINKAIISTELKSITKTQLAIKNADVNIPSKKLVANKPELSKNKDMTSFENRSKVVLNKSDSLQQNKIEYSKILSTKGNNSTASSKINKTNGTAYVYYVKTYERIALKGYRSEDMLIKIANAFFFDNEFEKAAKWYEELFKIKSNLEPEYYYRYSKSLAGINQTEKADRMMQLFKEKLKLNQSIIEKP